MAFAAWFQTTTSSLAKTSQDHPKWTAILSVSGLVAAACVYSKLTRAKDPYRKKAEKVWAEIMGAEPAAFERVGGNSLNYRVVKTSKPGIPYFLKITGENTSNDPVMKLVGLFVEFDRGLIEAPCAGDNWEWLKVCTKLVGQAGLGAKFFGSSAKGLVTEWTIGKPFGTEQGQILKEHMNEATIYQFGRFLGKLGRVKQSLERDEEAQAVASTVLTGHPFNWMEPVVTLKAYKDTFCGFPSVSSLKQQLLFEYEEMIKLPPLSASNPGAERVFIHSDCHAGNFMIKPDGSFVALDLEMASVQPAAHMLCNFTWTMSMMLGGSRFISCRRELAKGYLAEVSGLNEGGEEFAIKMKDLLWAMEYYTTRYWIFQFSLMALIQIRLLGLSSTHGLCLYYIMPKLRTTRELISEALHNPQLRDQIAEEGVDAVLEQRA